MFWTDDRTDTFASYSTFFPDSLLLTETKAWEPVKLSRLSSDIRDLSRDAKDFSVGLVMDVEGSEFAILEDLISAPELLAYVKLLAVEWHDAVIPSLGEKEAKKAKKLATERAESFGIHSIFTTAEL